MPRLGSIRDSLDYVRRSTGLWVPQPLRMVQRRCCCKHVCGACTGGSVPTSVQVDFANVGEVSCGSCNDFNTTSFILEPADEFDPATICEWEYLFSPVLCDVTRIHLWVHKIGATRSDVVVQVRGLVGNPTGLLAQFQDLNAAADLDCSAWNNTDVPYDIAQGMGQTCDWTTPATCALTAA